MARVMSSEEIAVLVRDAPDFDAAVTAWVDEVGEPMTWNYWQDGIKKIRPLFLDTAPDSREQSYNSRVSALRHEQMKRAFGPDWVKRPMLEVERAAVAEVPTAGGSRPPLPVGAAPMPVNDGGAAGSAALPELTAERLALVPAGGPQHFVMGTQVGATSAPPGSVRSVATGRSRASALGPASAAAGPSYAEASRE